MSDIEQGIPLSDLKSVKLTNVEQGNLLSDLLPSQVNNSVKKSPVSPLYILNAHFHFFL
jgi:hypothetical protein